MAKRKRLDAPPAGLSTKKLKQTADSDYVVRKRSQYEASFSTIGRFYEHVLPLKDYVLQALPSGSKVRTKRVLSFRDQSPENAHFLEQTLVAITKDVRAPSRIDHRSALRHFTQTQRAARPGSAASQHCTLHEIIDYVVSTLFKNAATDQHGGTHLLCNGLDRIDSIKGLDVRDYKLRLPDIIQRYQNPCTKALKRPLWHQLLGLLGSEGDTVFTSLLLNCAIFEYHTDTGSYYQICGNPMHKLLLAKPLQTINRTPSDISFVRGRILYSKPNLNCEGEVLFGLRRVHILNKLASITTQHRDRVLLQYIFPRQFRLHNVFTSKVDRTETTQPFKDYTVREDVPILEHSSRPLRTPSRLVTNALPLIQRIQRRYLRCHTDQLLYHYCPSVQVNRQINNAFDLNNLNDPSDTDVANASLCYHTQQRSLANVSLEARSTGFSPEDQETSLLPHCTSPAQVAAFCRAVLRRLLPMDAFGCGEQGESNWTSILHHVERFVHLRRYETISLHEVTQGLKLRCISWLLPNGAQSSAKLASTDKKKREELLNEFIYYVFDSLLIPLISTNFYVTESGIHRNKLLYFRHDVWLRLCQPHLESVKLSSLAPVSKKQLREITGVGQLSYSVVRLLPKEKGVRMITNLKRRVTITAGGRRSLDVSINTRLEPVFKILQFEKQDQKIGALDEQDLHRQLASFKSRLDQIEDKPFFFVKVDIKSAFDSIPRQNLLDLVDQLFKRDEYTLMKHATIKMLADNSSEKPSAKYAWRAGPVKEAEAWNTPDEYRSCKKHVVHVDVGRRYSISATEAKRRLQMHIRNNIIKIGHKYCKSARGIPQGSILSSFLCNFFYGHFVTTKLDFLQSQHSLLLRVIDDFLLITTSQTEAIQFVNTMRTGDAYYGIVAHPEKSLVNFDTSPYGIQIPNLFQSTSFPFCGLYIDTRNLEVSKDRVRKDNVVANTLTVDTNNHAGKKMMRKTLIALKIQLKNILIDSRLNDRDRVLQSLIECFQETAMKLHQYLMHIRSAQRPRSELLIKLIQQLIGYCFNVLKDRSAVTGLELSRPQVTHLAALAFNRVLRTKQSSYRQILLWLGSVQVETEHSLGMNGKETRLIVEKGSGALQHYVY